MNAYSVLLYEQAEALLHTAEAMYHCMQSFSAISQQTVSNHLPVGNNISDNSHTIHKGHTKAAQQGACVAHMHNLYHVQDQQQYDVMSMHGVVGPEGMRARGSCHGKDVMGYIASADAQPLLDLLGGSKQLLKKFQGLLGLQLAGPSASCQTPVRKLPKTCNGTVILTAFWHAD